MPSASAVVGTVDYWDNFTDQFEFTALHNVEDSFRTKYPAVQLKSEDIPNDSYLAKVTTAAKGSSLPDAGASDPQRLGDLVGIGALQDITTMAQAMPNYASFAPSTWAGATVGGKIYGLPSFMFIDWYYYRKDYFSDAGITAFPTKWDDFLTVTKKLTDPSKKRYGFGLRGGDGGADDLAVVIESFGTDLVDASGKAALDRDILIQALTYEADLFTKYHVTPPSTPSDGYQGIITGFTTGETAILKHHTGSLSTILKSVPPDKLGTAVAPGKSRIAAWIQTNYQSAFKAPVSDATWAWLAYWTDAATQVAFLGDTGYFPSNLDAAKDPRVLSQPLYAPAFDTIKSGRAAPSWAGYTGWSTNVLLPTFQEILTGATTPSQAADVIIAGLKKAVAA